MENKTEIVYHLQVTDIHGDSWTLNTDYSRPMKFRTRELAEAEANRQLGKHPSLASVKVLLVEKTPVTTIGRLKTVTPSLEQKVEQYESFLHLLNTMQLSGSEKGIQKLLVNADNWSYAHRVGNGELSEEEQQERINIKFWKLNDID